MAITVNNKSDHHLGKLLLVLEAQPESQLIVDALDFEKDATATGSVDFDGSASYVLSFYDEHEKQWVQGEISLTGDTLDIGYGGGTYTVSDSPGSLAVLEEADVRHEGIWITPSIEGEVSAEHATLALEFSPYQSIISIDVHTNEKTFWFIAVPLNNTHFVVSLTQAVFSFKSGTDWNQTTVDRLLNAENRTQSGDLARVVAYTIPTQIFQMFRTNPNTLTLDYRIGVSIDPEVLMESA